MKLSQFQALAAANPHGLVAMRVVEAFTPYAEGDIAGFQPDEALKLFISGHIAMLDGVEAPPPADDDEASGGGPETETVDIPEDWKDRHYLSRRALAAKIAGRPVEKEEADGVIEAEVARRAAAAA
ncbi:hypothetical protein [Phenylobacterium sp.]|uniref:hypothetical protein n=1 Tax=Phenylobacterium sp. TaxID=1871053 RepID=UPI00395BED26